MSISGGRSFNNSNTKGNNTLQDMQNQINENTIQIGENTDKLTGISYTPTTTSIDGELLLDGGVGFNNTINYGGQRLYIGSIPYGSDVWIWGGCRIVGLLTLHAGFFCGSATIDQNEIATLDGIDTSQTLQTQLNDKLSLLNGGTITGNVTLNGVFSLNNNLIVASLTISPTELSYLDGVSSNIQTQLNSKANTSGTTFTGLVVFSNGFICNATSTFNAQPSFYDKLQCYYNIKLNSTAGIELSSLTISQTELSYLSGVTSAIQTQLNSLNSLKFDKTGGTISGALICSSDVTFNGNIIQPINISYNSGASSTPQIKLTNTGNSKGLQLLSNSALNSINNFVGANESVIGTLTQNNSSLVLTTASASSISYGIRILSSSSTTATITTQVGTNNVVVNQTQVAINGDLTLGSGGTAISIATPNVTFYYGFTSTLDATFQANTTTTGTITTSNNITQSGSTSSTNKFTQSTTVAGDVNGNDNLLKYTQIKYNCNSSSGTSYPCLTLLDSYNANSIFLIPNSSSGAYNNIVPANGRSIVAAGTNDNNNISLTNWGTVTNGVKCTATNSTTANVLIQSGSNSINVSNTTGIALTGVSSIGFTGGKTIDGNYGTIYTATLNTTTLTTNTDTNVATALSLPAGTYIINWICGFHVMTGSTTISNYLAGYSTSSSSYTDIVARGSFIGQTCPVDTYFTLSGSTTITFASSTSIYLRCTCVFGTASRVEFRSDISQLTAVKIV